MRYEIESYMLIGVEHFRVIDTFNGGKIMAKGFRSRADAQIRIDEVLSVQRQSACSKAVTR